VRDLPFRVTANAQRPLLPTVGSQGLDPNRQIGQCEREPVAGNPWMAR
jgi:hypothetical protein